MTKKQMLEELRLELNKRNVYDNEEDLNDYLTIRGNNMYEEGAEKRLRKNKQKRERTLYEDTYNNTKTWEVTELADGRYYLRQYNANRQNTRGRKVTKARLEEMGILEMKVLKHVYN